ncbi:dicarboxylate/amino acid:cation symporter [Candidatus Macondimonas diazotrophica]|jgi:Na+/H+-dicarboxylate symporter|uniref:Dicarboxylate/amino acid:cation symporter n=1 Tax=Candidatus Macondimonas diazotrophica TaxID=2305248 RepID=A0A4Z0FCJ5_9GAMM|nr:dicarboxylate/amino acid:cation symporter [Candidatus Macondimonas diazotrophica]NCU00710.1 dicarboxylate/amino acid:cation symporter [Candidatus Macondimonas diazotrophica]TFZ83504.1 dicarboxylate/amino acid:cation symporter [Candidatus Macondimonas diazotrophica]HBG51756.1 dicarboxylate/amino acid:cation symporter [Gammaproteobacteria bacterium]
MRNPLRWPSHIQILVALISGAAVGPLLAGEQGLIGPALGEGLAQVGQLFLSALKMLVIPLIMASIIAGLNQEGSRSPLGRMGWTTLVFYIATGLIAVTVAIVLANWIRPGELNGVPLAAQIGLQTLPGDLDPTLLSGQQHIALFLQRLVPSNLVEAAVEGQLLGLILFSLLFGLALRRLHGAAAETQVRFWTGLNQVMLAITDGIMRLAPVGIFALIAAMTARTGFSAAGPLLWFMATVMAGLLIHLMVTLPLLLRWIARVPPRRHFQAMMPALLMAFSTSSSAATLPVTMDCLERRAGVSRRTAGFVLPLGATVNMDGTALFECVVVLFVAQLYGIDLTLAQQALVLAVALLTSFGVAGIPSASLVSIAMILSVLGLPLEALGLVLGVDRILDMSRTAVNVFGDTVGAVVVARLEGEQEILIESPDVREHRLREQGD